MELPDLDIALRDGPAVGIDMGLTHFATLSTSEMIENPRWFREAKEQLALLQCKRTRHKRGSRRYQELSRQIRRLHERVANKRRDFQHKLSTRLVQEHRRRRLGAIPEYDQVQSRESWYSVRQDQPERHYPELLWLWSTCSQNPFRTSA